MCLAASNIPIYKVEFSSSLEKYSTVIPQVNCYYIMKQIQKHQIDDTDTFNILSTQSTASLQDVNHLLNVPEEAILYTVIDKIYRKLIDTNYLAGQRKKTSKIWDHGINMVDLETRKKYWLCWICMCSKYL